MKNFACFLISAVVLLCIPGINIGQTYVSGGIFTNTTWAKVNSPFIVTDTVVVFPGVSLTIEPGVTVKFNDSTRLEIRMGALTAIGNSLDSIKFTSNSGSPGIGSWNDIYFNGNGLQDTCSFGYCAFEYAKWGIQSSYYPLNIHHSNFRFNDVAIDYSFGFSMSGESLHLDNCVFNNNNSGITGYNSSVYADSCDFFNSDSGINSYGTDLSFTNCLFRDNNTGVHNDGGLETSMINCVVSNNQTGIILNNLSAILKDCIIDSNSVDGLYCSIPNGDSIINCKFRFNNIGYRTYGSGLGQNILTENIFEYNDIGIKIEDVPDITYCNRFCNNQSYDLYYMSQYNYSYQNNFWCTFDSSVIASKIYDGYDNFNYGLVDFMPIDTIECFLINSISVQQFNIDEISVFPNPVKEVLSVMCENGELCEFKLFDINSRLIIHQPFFRNTSILTDDISNGIFIYEITNRNGFCYRGKVIIERD